MKEREWALVGGKKDTHCIFTASLSTAETLIAELHKRHVSSGCWGAAIDVSLRRCLVRSAMRRP